MCVQNFCREKKIDVISDFKEVCAKSLGNILDISLTVQVHNIT